MSVTITTEIADDIMCNAVETGIGYWFNDEATKAEFTKFGFCDEVDVSNWRYLAVQFDGNFEEGPTKHYSVTAEDIVRVFPEFSEKYPHLAKDYVGEYNGDASSDDAVFQFAAFGEVIFG